MSLLRQPLLITALVTITLCSAAVEPVKLSRKVKVGDKHEYKTVMILSTSAFDIDVEMTAIEKVLKVNDDGSYVLEETQADQMIMVAGQDQPSPPDASGKVYYSKTGEITKIEASTGNADDLSTANLMTVVWPTKAVDVGSKWEGDKKSELGVNHQYRILAREKIGKRDTFKISIKSELESGDGASATGTIWIEISTGMAVKTIGEMQNVATAGMVMDTISFTSTLID